MSSDSLVSLSPSETLLFDLVKDTAPKVTLKVTNNSLSKVVFKVKTTQPSWYYVRPNQQVIDVGQTEEVVIVLIDSECSRFLERAAEGKAERLDKHRFLVQSKTIEDEDFEKVSAISAAERSEEYTRIWGSGPKDEKKNLRLKVDFKYPPFPIDTINDNNDVNNIRSKIDENNPDNRDSHSTEEKGEDDDLSPESLLLNLKNQRMKYNAIVDYTVLLTAERDTIQQRLEESDRELSRENARKRGNGGDPPRAKKDEKILPKATVQQGFSLNVVLFLAVFFFFLGRYLKAT